MVLCASEITAWVCSTLCYLTDLGVVTSDGRARHRRGLSTTHAGSRIRRMEWRRGFSSATLRGVGRDARYIVARLLDRQNAR